VLGEPQQQREAQTHGIGQRVENGDLGQLPDTERVQPGPVGSLAGDLGIGLQEPPERLLRGEHRGQQERDWPDGLFLFLAAKRQLGHHGPCREVCYDLFVGCSWSGHALEQDWGHHGPLVLVGLIET
jgi:hypothetical protein